MNRRSLLCFLTALFNVRKPAQEFTIDNEGLPILIRIGDQAQVRIIFRRVQKALLAAIISDTLVDKASPHHAKLESILNRAKEITLVLTSAAEE
jgi:hypothetical protein